MTAETPKRPWWRKKRWWAAGLLWLPLLYLLAEGPGHGAMVSGRITVKTYDAAFWPVNRAVGASPKWLPFRRTANVNRRFWRRVFGR